MIDTRRTGRPLQVLAVLTALLVGWIAGRWPLLQWNVAVAVARAERDQMLAIASTRARLTAAPTSTPRRAPVDQQVDASQPAPISSALTSFAKADFAGGARLHSGSSAFPGAATTAGRILAETGTVPESRAALNTDASPTRSISDSNSAPAITRPSAFDFATRAYAALAAGDRRSAAQDFDAALAADRADPQAPAWVAARRALNKRWSGNAYVFARQGPDPVPTSLSPGSAGLLGGSQSVAALAFTPRPLARRPLDLTARLTGSNSLDQRQAEAAIGVRWRLLPQLGLSAERLIALGAGGRRDWTLRLAGGHSGRIGPVALDGYGETGIVGITHPAYFVAGQALAGYPITVGTALTLTPGAGVWGGFQRDRLTKADRVDVGPSLRLHWARTTLPVDATVDYRVRVGGNAGPGSGAALTLSTGF